MRPHPPLGSPPDITRHAISIDQVVNVVVNINGTLRGDISSVWPWHPHIAFLLVVLNTLLIMTQCNHSIYYRNRWMIATLGHNSSFGVFHVHRLRASRQSNDAKRCEERTHQC